MKKYITLSAVAMSLLATGCSNDLITDNSAVDNTGKERIVLGAGDDQTAFQTRAGFTAQTRIVARYVSDSRDGSYAKVVKTVLNASAEADSKGYSDVAYASTDYVRYWDDAYGRKSILSVYAVAIPNKDSYVEESVTKYYIDESNLSGTGTWGTSDADANSISWTVKTTQVYADLEDQDLTYSNNIQQTGKKGVWTYDFANNEYPDIETNAANATQHSYTEDETAKTDGRMYFTQKGKTIKEALTEDPGKFDKGQMEFKHALSRIQVNLKKGEGYTGTLSLTGNLQLNNMPYTGTLNIKSGEWTGPTTGTVNMAQWATAAASKDLTYEAQVLPGYVFADDGKNAMQFTIGDNTYYITNKMLRAALDGKTGVTADYNMLQGNRYIFDITVKKAEITNITATIVDWNEVEAEDFEIDNSHLTFKFYDNNNACEDVKLYKFEQGLENIVTTDDDYAAAPVAASAYTAVEGFVKVDGKDYYTTSEYYKDNKTAYHFRSLNTTAASALASDGKTFTMTSGNDDYHWGAPMLPTTLTAIPYSSETGYSTTIAKGIIAADKNSDINLTEIHMMSQLVIKLTTPETGGVDLTDAEVYLTKYSATGIVDMSLGKITPATTITDKSSKFAAAASPATNTYVFNVVPQELKRNSGATDNDYVGITIKTKDNNEYYIIKKLSDIIGTAGTEVTNMQTAGAITIWYPGHRYTYTFNIKKKEIEVITATIVPWNDVTGANTDLDLEK